MSVDSNGCIVGMMIVCFVVVAIKRSTARSLGLFLLYCGASRVTEFGYLCIHEILTITEQPARSNWTRAIADKSTDHSKLLLIC